MTCVWPWWRTSSPDDFIQHLNVRAMFCSTVVAPLKLLYFCRYLLKNITDPLTFWLFVIVFFSYEVSFAVRCSAHFKDAKATAFLARIIHMARLTATWSKAEQSAPVK